MTRKALVCSLAVGLVALKFANAHAAQVSDEVLVSDWMFTAQSGANMISFETPGAGEISVTLTAINLPPLLGFSSLEFGLDDSAGLKTGMIQGGRLFDLDTTTYDLAGPTKFDADIFGSLSGFVGLYNFTVTYEPKTVPLPTSAVSLLGGLGLLGAVRRRRATQ